jgi:type VI secretion system secreted protein VgrG
MAPLTQENRQIAVHTPLGKDVFLLSSFQGVEEMSRLFEFQLNLLSEDASIKPADIVGTNLTFTVKLSDQNPRYFNGFVSRFSAGSAESGLRRYRLEVVPWLWFLTRTSDCRIFQDKTTPEIIAQVFQDLKFGDFDTSNIKGTYPKWEYCVQYRETDFNFVSRLMEQAGIFYYFRHGNGGHTMVLSDQTGAYQNCPEKDVEFEDSSGSLHVVDRITGWEHQYEFRPGKFSRMDYNFETPQTSLATSTDSVIKLTGNDGYEIYDYPGEYRKKSDGDPETKARMEEEETPYHIVHGSSTCKTFTTGGKFTLKRHPLKSEENKGYVITSISHSATEPATYEGGQGVAQDYSNTFTCIPDSVTYRPARITGKPIIRGTQTAVVTGPKDEEIWTDKYGRIKVQFFWDREGKCDEKSSCWIRCMQTSAGKKWGAMFIPRIGQEVIVRYLEGDPDQPIVTGVLYNAGQMPHYKLADEKTKSYIKTNSTLGGEGFNELRFEDKKGEEQIFIHAQRNMDVRVLNDSMERTFGNRHQIIGSEKDGKKTGDQREMVYQDKHLDIKRHQIEHIEGNMELLIGHGEAQSGGNQDIIVEKTKSETVEGDSHLHVKGNRNEAVGSESLSAGSQQEKVGGRSAWAAGKEIHCKAGTGILLEAGSQITLKGPGGFIDIGSSGIAIQGTQVLINCGGSPGSGTACSPGGAQPAAEASPSEPARAADSKPGQKSSPPAMPVPPPPPTPGPPRAQPAPPGPKPKPPEPKPTPVGPLITPATSVVVVKKTYTNPARRPVTLKTDSAFDGKGTFTRSAASVKFFNALTGGTEITFNGTDNVFQGPNLSSGVTLFAEGATPSSAPDDVKLTLTLSGGTKPLKPAATAKMTSVELTLDICEPRTDPKADPTPLAQPPATIPAPGTGTDKLFLGRPVPVEPDWDNARPSERAMLIIRQVKPAKFKGKLSLKTLNDKIDLFADEAPKKGEAKLANPFVIDADKVSSKGHKLFVQGAKQSAAARDTGFRLGIENVEEDGDRVAVTAVYCEAVSNVEQKNMKLVAIVPEKPERKPKSKFMPPPLIVGLKYDVELRPHVELGKPSAFKWSTTSSRVTLTDTDKEVLKLNGKSLSGKEKDVEIELLLTMDVGKMKKKHKLTVAEVEINPVISGDKLKHTDAINIIKNPSGIVILTGGDASDAGKVAKVQITKIKPDLTWKDDDDRISWWIIGGEAAVAGSAKYEGKADFRNDEAAKRGTKIEVFGSQQGDVLIQPYSGGYGYGMFRANIVPLKKLKYRICRLFTKEKPAVPASPGVAAKPKIPARNPTGTHDDAKKHVAVMNIYLRMAGIEMVPDDSAEAASSAGNNKVGLAALDPKVVAVTKVSNGHFDVEVNDQALTFKASNSDSLAAIRINTRNEVICFAYINSQSSSSALATALLCPWNHAPQAKADPPRAYSKAAYTLPDKGTPSSSLIPKTGIPGNTPVDEVKMVVLKADVNWQGSTPATRDVDLLWGVIVPTTSIDKSGSAKGGDSTILAYANTLAHEVGHVLGLGHRGDLSAGVPDGLTIPNAENLMHPDKPPPTAQNIDIIQVKAIRFSEALFRSP